ncbi:Dyp-type peroxidase [Methyloprofundus sp.]|uniref:Dyp-type peroxidase n=1 Tax=Methyloprofundus sp. TaxID=2020875 RepID=UPI003D148AA3
MMYGRGNNFASWKQEVQGEHFSNAFQIISELPTSNILDKEPFGFSDGISQPKIDWDNQQSTEIHTRDRYSNLLAKGEVVLGYKNEYGYYTDRPLINVGVDPQACILPDAEDKPGLKDLGRNGSYLICRQLSQDVQGFWRFMQEQAGDNREQLAAAMVGRQLDDKGTPLITELGQNIPGIENKDNNFNYDQDPVGNQCPISAHIRRSNPRTGDLSAGPPGLISRLKRKLGFGLKPEDDLVTSTRYHRLLRRGRAYGTMLSPEQAIVSKEKNADRGLQFICLAGNISRQFEFVQNAWNDNSKFSGLQQQSDPILGNRHKLLDGEASNQFHQPQAAGPQHKTCQLPQFVTVRGGGYFFMPGLRALQYLTTLTDVPE